MKNQFLWNPSMCDCECNKTSKIRIYLNIKNCSCEKCLVGKLVLECEDEVLNATEAFNKKSDMKKLLYSHYFIGNDMLVISSHLG